MLSVLDNIFLFSSAKLSSKVSDKFVNLTAMLIEISKLIAVEASCAFQRTSTSVAASISQASPYSRVTRQGSISWPFGEFRDLRQIIPFGSQS